MHPQAAGISSVLVLMNVLFWKMVNSFRNTLTDCEKRSISKCEKKLSSVICIKILYEKQDTKDEEAKDKDSA